jgi:RNA polymerase-binding transcription factor DksA
MKPIDLNQYKRHLTVLQERLQQEIGGMKATILTNQLARGEQDHVASEAVDKEISLEAVEELISYEVSAALDRIDVGAYGYCIDCDAEIPRARLDAIPFTSYCVHCEEMRQN